MLVEMLQQGCWVWPDESDINVIIVFIIIIQAQKHFRHTSPTLVTPHTLSNCRWYLGVWTRTDSDPLTDQALLDWLWTNPWNSRTGFRPSAHFLCVWEEQQPLGLKCISWLCIKLLLMTRSASVAMPTHLLSPAHPLREVCVCSQRDTQCERMREVEDVCVCRGGWDTQRHWWMDQELRRWN